MGGELVPDLRRAGTFFKAPAERALGLFESLVAGVTDAQIGVRLPPLRRLFYYLLVRRDGLRIAAEHVQGVRPEGLGAAPLLVVGRIFESLFEEVQGLGVVCGVEGDEPGVYEHVGVFGVVAEPAQERGARQLRLPHEPVVAAEFDVSIRMPGVGFDGPFQVVDDLERLLPAHRHHSEPQRRRRPLRVQRPGVQKARLGLLQAVQAQERPANGLYRLGVSGRGLQRLLKAGERLLDQSLLRQGLALL